MGYMDYTDYLDLFGLYGLYGTNTYGTSQQLSYSETKTQIRNRNEKGWNEGQRYKLRYPSSLQTKQNDDRFGAPGG